MAAQKPADALAQHWTDGLGPPASSPAERKPHLGWYSRGYLPHCDSAFAVQHIVFCLADAIPPALRPPSAAHTDRALDAGYGSCVLRQVACASAVEEVLLHSDGHRYRLAAWCVMPNHVHVIAEQIDGYPLGDVVQAWKSSAAHLINPMIGRRGRLWRREYFDRFMRNEDHLSNTISYVEQNPVSAKLVASAGEWRWSSAWRRSSAGEDAGGPRSAP